jgi:hypothetical protein
MRFPHAEQLKLPCTIEHIVPGQLHADGRRYLPLIVLGFSDNQPGTLTQLGVVDRHHRVDLTRVGQSGSARLVFLLSSVQILTSPRIGLFDTTLAPGRTSTMPTACGQVVEVLAWETDREHLPYETLYTELILDIGVGQIGVRTSSTAASLSEKIGKAQIEPGDWIQVDRSRIDVLDFV